MATSIGNVAVQLTADPQGLLAGMSAAQQSVTSFGQRAQQTATRDVSFLTQRFEKLGSSIRQLGALTAALQLIDTGSTNTKLDQTIGKAQQFALTVGSFAGPKGQLLALGFVGVAEGVKFLNNAFRDDSADKYREKMEKLRAEQAKIREGVNARITTLREEVETFGMSAAEVEAYRLKKIGATAGDIAYAKSLIEQKEALEKQADAQKEAGRAAEEAAKKTADAWMKSLEDQRKASEEQTADILKFIEKVNMANAESRGMRSTIASFGSSAAISAIRESRDAQDNGKKFDKMIQLLKGIQDSIFDGPAVATTIKIEEAQF